MKLALQRNLDLNLVADDIRDYVCQITGMNCA
uniref:Initiation factor IF-3 n=1 Tax=mine drainage metagenome TaxID=410659 RepID=E6QVN2_9ZZZZ